MLKCITICDSCKRELPIKQILTAGWGPIDLCFDCLAGGVQEWLNRIDEKEAREWAKQIRERKG